MISLKSSGSKREASGVDPTRSQNISVSCRRSASDPAARVGPTTPSACSACRTAMASSSLRRWPSEATPISLRSSFVRDDRSGASMSLSRKIASYCSRPKFLSQPRTSMAPPGFLLMPARKEGHAYLSRQSRIMPPAEFYCRLFRPQRQQNLICDGAVCLRGRRSPERQIGLLARLRQHADLCPSPVLGDCYLPPSPIRVTPVDGSNGARRRVPAAPAECRLCDRKGDPGLGAREWARCADSGLSLDDDQPSQVDPKPPFPDTPIARDRVAYAKIFAWRTTCSGGISSHCSAAFLAGRSSLTRSRRRCRWLAGSVSSRLPQSPATCGSIRDCANLASSRAKT